MEETFEVSVFTTPTKRRGRPRKADTVLLPAEMTVLGVLQTASAKRKSRPKARTITSTCNDSPLREGKQSEIVGQAVHGVVDGSFDTGFLVTLRVGKSESVYRGAVFGPGLSIPLSESRGVAAKVNAARKQETLGSPTPPSPPPTAPAEVSSHAPLSTGRIPPVFKSYSPSNSDRRHLTSRQELPSSLNIQSGFMHPAASFPYGAQGFAGREFCNTYELTGAEISYESSLFSSRAQADGSEPR